MRTNEQIDQIRQTASEAVRLNVTAFPGIHVKQIGYETTKRWLEGVTELSPLESVPAGHIMEGNRNTGPQYEKGVLMALDEVAPVKPPRIWIDPEFMEYLEEQESPVALTVHGVFERWARDGVIDE